VKIEPVHKASCHCRSIQFELDLPEGLDDLRRCSCSMCSRRGAIVASVPLDGIRVTKGEDLLSLYQFNTMTARHFFCSKCGIYTHHQRRSNPHQFAFNVACLEGVNPFELGDVSLTDGINHPSDQ
jgi:hypothetical protein